MSVERIELVEYEVRNGVRLSRDVAAALSASSAVTVTPSTWGEDRWDLRASDLVGVVRVGSCELRISPKVPVGRLLFLISYALDKAQWKDAYDAFHETRDLLSAIVHAFLLHTEAALSRGVLQGYRHRDDSLAVLRGRIRVNDQIRERYGLPVPLEVSYDDFTIDIAENRLLKSAAVLLTQVPRLPDDFRHRLTRIARTLDSVETIRRGLPVPTVRIDRRNRRYGRAIELARLILHATSIDVSSTATVRGSSFLIKMWSLFERFLEIALGEAFAKYGGILHPQFLGRYLDDGGVFPLKPDLVWEAGGVIRMVADVKYKSAGDAGVPNTDVYQALAYAVAFDLADAHLIYAHGNQQTVSHVIPGADRTVHVHTVDLDQSPEDLLDTVSALAFRIVEATSALSIMSPA